MSIAQYFSLTVPFTVLFDTALSVATGVGGNWWTISVIAVLMDVTF